MTKWAILLFFACVSCINGQECATEPHSKTWKTCLGNNREKTCTCTACPTKNEDLVCRETNEAKASWIPLTTTCVQCLIGKCWSSYTPSPRMICANPEGEMELPVGAKFNCTCDNCAPVTIKCESKGSAKQWKYDGICESDTYMNVSIPTIHPKALISKNGNEYKFTCATGYKTNGSKDLQCDRGKIHPGPSCEIIKCSGEIPTDIHCPEGVGITEAEYGDTRQCNWKSTCMPINVTCDSYGNWSYTCRSCCTDAAFPATALMEFGDNILTSFENNKLQFECRNGYQLEGNLSVKCNNGVLNSLIPKCVEITAHRPPWLWLIIIIIILVIIGIIIIVLSLRLKCPKFNI